MKATKFTMTIEVNTLSIDSIPALLIELAGTINKEIIAGEHTAADGDNIFWSTEKEEVQF